MRKLIARLLFFPTLGWNLLLNRVKERWDWWNRIDDHVVVGAFPFRRLVPELQEAGVRAVVNTCEEYGGPVAEYEAPGEVDRKQLDELGVRVVPLSEMK